MDNPVFHKASLLEPTFWQRVFKRRPPENAFIEIENLLAEKPLRQINFRDVQNIAIDYDLNLLDEDPPQLNGLYIRYLEWTLSNGEFSLEDLSDLKHLERVLCIRHTALGPLISMKKKEALDKLLSDTSGQQEICQEGVKHLDHLRRALRLEESVIPALAS